MNRSAVVSCALMGTALCLPPPAFAQPNFSEANAALAAVAAKAKAPGASFAVGAGGRIVDVTEVGFADTAARTPVAADTMFALASCSKPITAMAVMKLVDEGKLTLATRAFPFLGITGGDARLDRITIKMLLNHSSGLRHDANASTDDPMNTARAAARTELRFDPGTDQAYSNAGFNVLGAVIEKATGRRYIDVVRDTVFAPAGVTRFGALDPAVPIPGQAVRYDKGGRVVTDARVEGGTPAGGWVLSPTDMVRILMAYDAGHIVSHAARDAMLEPPAPPLKARPDGSAFGLGWDVVLRTGGAVLYGKNGGILGSSTWIEHRPDGIVFAAFYNGGSGAGAHRPGLAGVEAALDGR